MSENSCGFLYILQSELNSRYYIGSTTELTKRMHEHSKGYVKATRNIRPLKLRFFKKFDTIREARRIEYKLKKMKSKIILERIINEQELKLTL